MASKTGRMAPRVTEDVLNALSEHHLMEDLATVLADEAVVHLRLAVWL